MDKKYKVLHCNINTGLWSVYLTFGDKSKAIKCAKRLTGEACVMGLGHAPIWSSAGAEVVS